MRYTKVYVAWRHMKDRCTNPNFAQHKDYGGRGIKVCDEWINSFIAYYNFVSKLPNYGVKGYTLDRINNDKGYYPSNVKYSTWSEQQSNKRPWGTSKFKGVCWHKASNKWMARIRINGKRIHIGLFNTELEASKAYKKALGEIVPL